MIKFIEPQTVHKGWGYETIIQNNSKYCGKILHFNCKAEFSMHFHMIKDETWFVQEGNFCLAWIDPQNAKHYERNLEVGDVVHIPPGSLHKLSCISDIGRIYEVSTQHFDDDSYRVLPGDSQKE